MLEQRSKKRIKTDKRDAEIIAKCLAQHNYSPVHIPTAKDEETKEFLRMRDDHKLALKKVKQQILAFCLRHNYRYDGNSHWTAAHLKWLKALTPEALYKEILDKYLLTYQTLSDKLEKLDKRIEELATQDEYLVCLYSLLFLMKHFHKIATIKSDYACYGNQLKFHYPYPLKLEVN